MPRKRTPKWLVAASQHPGEWPRGQKPDWISRVLGRAGAVAPEALDAALAAGRATINGKPAREPLTLVRPADEVRFDGQPVPYRPPTRVLMLHKPPQTVSSTRDPDGHRTVFDALRARLSPELARYTWLCVGRLDIDTTGLLLFTNDERFVGHGTAPDKNLSKRYIAYVRGPSDEARLQPLREGVTLHDGPTKPAQARFRDPGVVELTISEGRNHQVKRMLGAVGLPVLTLHREAVGELVLDVPEGELRELTSEEIRQKLGFDLG